MDRILKEERNYILSMIKKIRATGCNVLLIQKSILRDAVTDLSLHYLAKAKILVVKVRMGSSFSPEIGMYCCPSLSSAALSALTGGYCLSRKC
jgi:chaperonin GroEL (HSP60 family)